MEDLSYNDPGDPGDDSSLVMMKMARATTVMTLKTMTTMLEPIEPSAGVWGFRPKKNGKQPSTQPTHWQITTSASGQTKKTWPLPLTSSGLSLPS
jgi:hypothetical protein